MGCAQVGKPGSRLIRLWLLPLVLFASGSGPLMAQTLLGEDISELYAPGEERPAWVRPKVLNPEDVGIGETVPDFGFVDVSGKSGRLSDLLHERAGLVIAIRDTACPVPPDTPLPWHGWRKNLLIETLVFCFSIRPVTMMRSALNASSDKTNLMALMFTSPTPISWGSLAQ